MPKKVKDELLEDLNDFDDEGDQVVSQEEALKYFQDYNGMLLYKQQHGMESLIRRMQNLGPDVMIRFLKEAAGKDTDTISNLSMKNDALQQQVISTSWYIDSIQNREMESVKRFFEKDKMMHEVVMTINETLKTVNRQSDVMELLSTTVVACLKREWEDKDRIRNTKVIEEPETF